ncbi:MAG: protein kinase [Pirellulales bacterium]
MSASLVTPDCLTAATLRARGSGLIPATPSPPPLTPPPRTGEGNLTLEQLVEAASQRLERGEPLDVEALCAEHPEHAEELRELLPAVAMLFHIGAEPVDRGSNGASEALPYARLGDFQLIREVGRGGMGTVYEAEQISLRRRVALKVLPFASVLDKQQLARFQNEARAAATLDHSHIVAVHSVGSDRGVHFYAMQLIESQSLAEVVEEKRRTESGKRQQAPSPSPSPADGGGGSGQSAIGNHKSAIASDSTGTQAYYRGVAELGIQAARALEHAHANGVLHRDVKPANLLLDGDGKLWVTDFGLARICSEAGLTTSGDLLGTLRYMSPEQISAKRGIVDHRSDIYSLGATLYELLALTPAFGGDDRPELLRQIAVDEPLRLRQRDRRIPIDLETIIDKAMEKNPAARYATGGELADDLQRFVDQQPILARPATYADRVVKWSRRHHGLVAAAAIGLLLLSAVLLSGIGMVNRARLGTVAALDETAELLYVADMGAAYQAWEKGWADEAHKILERHRPKEGEPDRCGFEWHLLNAATAQPDSVELAGHEGAVNEIAVFPDGRRLASVGDDGTLRIWDLRSNKQQFSAQLDDQPLYSVAVSPDTRHVAAGGKKLYLGDLNQRSECTEIFCTEHNLESLAFHPDGDRLAAGSRYHSLFLLKLDGEMIASADCGSRVQSLEFVPDGRLLVPTRSPAFSASRKETARIWSGDLTSTAIEFPPQKSSGIGAVRVARLSPSGEFVLTGSRDSTATVFAFASGLRVASMPPSRAKIMDMAFAPNTSTFGIAYTNGIVEIHSFDREVGKAEPKMSNRLSVFQAHRGDASSLKFVNDDTLATCGADGLVKIWKLNANSARSYSLGPQMISVKISPDGSLLAHTHIHGCDVLKMSNAKKVGHVSGSTQSGAGSAWSPSGDRQAICIDSADGGSISILDRIGVHLHSLDDVGSLNCVEFSPDDRTLASIGDRRKLRLHDSENGNEIETHTLPSVGMAVAFTRDGSRLAYSMEAHDLAIVSVPEFASPREFRGSRDAGCLAFNLDDSLLASGHDDGTIRLWDVDSGRLLNELTGHESKLRDVAFTPDGKTLLSAANDGTVRLWSVEHGREYGVFFRARSLTTNDPVEFACRVCLANDGKQLVIGDGNRESRFDAHIWQLPERDSPREFSVQ